MNVSQSQAAGLRSLPNKVSSFASTQAAWRFYDNERVTLPALAAPLLERAHLQVERYCTDYALCVHDWSRLNYRRHSNKSDRYPMTHETDVGYELQSSLLVSDTQGAPLVPVAHNLVTAEHIWSSYHEAEEALPRTHLDELSKRIRWLEQQSFSQPLVHIIDREGDSVSHFREWQDALWLVRARKTPRIEYQGSSQGCGQVSSQLNYRYSREIAFKGKPAQQWVGEARVRLTRPAKPSQKKRKRPPVPGEALEVRLVVSQVRNQAGDVLAEWLLLTNLKADAVPAEQVALWYYWRWRIESFFKLLKSAGQQIESWQQTHGEAIAKRLLVVSMACVLIWEIAANQSQSAKEFRQLLIKLSGRQMKWGKEFTHPALLAGLWVYLSMLELIETYPPEQLRQFKILSEGILDV